MRKRRVVGRIYGMKYSRKGYKDRNRHKNRIKKECASSVGLCQKHKPQHPHHVKVSPRGLNSKDVIIIIIIIIIFRPLLQAWLTVCGFERMFVDGGMNSVLSSRCGARRHRSQFSTALCVLAFSLRPNL